MADGRRLRGLGLLGFPQGRPLLGISFGVLSRWHRLRSDPHEARGEAWGWKTESLLIEVESA